MSLEVGGRADKQGNIYENRFLAKLLLELIQERLHSIEVEPLGKDGEGIEFVATDTNGERRYYQCKASNAANNHWRPSDLARYNVFQRAKDHILSEEGHTYHFISPLAYDELDELCYRARTVASTSDFFDHQLTNKGLRNWKNICEQYFETDGEELVYLLQHCYFEQIPDGFERIRELEGLITLLFLKNSPQTPSTIRTLLENYANDNHSWGKAIKASDVVLWLEAQGFQQRILSHDERCLPRIRTLNHIYQESFKPVGAELFHRKESDAILEHVGAGKSVIVLGKAGSGKSGCIHEVARTLESKNIAHLVLPLDKYQPTQSPDHYGQQLGLLDSPVSSIYSLSGKQQCVLIFDQLDALRWTNNSTSTALDVCKEMIWHIGQLNRSEGGKISCVFVVRTFDYETDPGLQSLFESKDDNKLQWETVRVDQLSEHEVKQLIGDSYATLSHKLCVLLQTPSNLYVWTKLTPNSGNQIEDLRQLMGKWWAQLKQNCVEMGLDSARIDYCRNRLVSMMQTREALSLPLMLFQDEQHEIDALASQGMLIKTEQTVFFTHQSFFDFFSVQQQVDELYEKGKHLPDIYSDMDKQTPDVRYQLLMLLQYLCDTDSDSFLLESQLVLKSSNLRYYFQCCVFEVIGQIKQPNRDLWELLYCYYNTDKWHDYLVQMVFWGHPQFISLIAEMDSNYAWHEDEGRSLLRSIIRLSPDLVLRILRGYGIERFEDHNLYELLSAAPAQNSEEAFKLRLNLIKRNNQLLLDDFDLYSMIEDGSAWAIPMIKTLIEMDPVQRSKYHFPESKYLHSFAEKNAEQIIRELLSPVLLAARQEKKEYYRASDWRSRRYQVTSERSIVQIIQSALSWMAANKSEQFLLYLQAETAESPIEPEIVIHAVEKLPFEYSDHAINWLLSDFDYRAFDITSPEKSKLTCCRRVIERFSPHCKIETFAKLESFLYYWSPSKKETLSNLEYRAYAWQQYKIGAYGVSLWGDLQYVLLPVLDHARITEKTERLIGVLQRKFPEGTKKFDLDTIEGGLIVSPIESRYQRLSNKNWIQLVIHMSRCTTIDRWKNWHLGTESSPHMFANTLERAAKEEPLRFAKLLLQLPLDVQEDFITAILDSLHTPEVPLDLVCDILRRFCQEPSHRLAISYARIIEKRSNEIWPSDILQHLIQIAVQHIHPLPDQLPIHSAKDEENPSCNMLWQNSFNCARGCAIHAISELLWDHPELGVLFHDAIEQAAMDQNPCIPFAVMRCAIAWYNIDEQFSEQLFMRLLGRDLRTLYVSVAWEILRRCYHGNEEYYYQQLMLAANAQTVDLKQRAMEMITTIAVRNDRMLETLLSMKLDDDQIESVCRQAVEGFQDEESHERSKRILIHLMDISTDKLSMLSVLFLDKCLDIKRDQGFVIKMLLGRDAHIANYTLEFIKKADGNLLEYAEPLSTFVTTKFLSQNSYINLNDLVVCVARLCHQGKNDLTTRKICLELWDRIFYYRPTAIKPLTDIMDQV